MTKYEWEPPFARFVAADFDMIYFRLSWRFAVMCVGVRLGIAECIGS